MSMTRGHLPLLIICLSLNSVLPAYAQSEGELAGAPVLQVERAALIALEHNPGLAALQAQAEAVHALPSQAGVLPDPMLSLNATNLPVNRWRYSVV